MNHPLVDQIYTFPDGNSITVTQVKIRDENIEWVTYKVKTGPGIPQKFVLPIHEFMNMYGHLFGNTEDNSSDANE